MRLRDAWFWRRGSSAQDWPRAQIRIVVGLVAGDGHRGALQSHVIAFAQRDSRKFWACRWWWRTIRARAVLLGGDQRRQGARRTTRAADDEQRARGLGRDVQVLPYDPIRTSRCCRWWHGGLRHGRCAVISRRASQGPVATLKAVRTESDGSAGVGTTRICRLNSQPVGDGVKSSRTCLSLDARGVAVAFNPDTSPQSSICMRAIVAAAPAFNVTCRRRSACRTGGALSVLREVRPISDRRIQPADSFTRTRDPLVRSSHSDGVPARPGAIVE